MPACRLAVLGTALLTIAAISHATLCLAQGAAKGADHYEVTIAPPARPGSKPAPVPENETDKELPSADPIPTDAPAASGATTPPAAARPAEAAKPSGPLHTLQVGAYRQRRSAEEMGQKLGSAFGEVAVVEVESGGEKLYRVRVGKLPAGPGLTDLKRRLLAAGYPAFEVELPPAPR